MENGLMGGLMDWWMVGYRVGRWMEWNGEGE